MLAADAEKKNPTQELFLVNAHTEVLDEPVFSSLAKELCT
jgi:hypothetical protein